MKRDREPDSIYIAAIALAVLLPCLPLLNWECTFPADWPNQIWLINYFGAFFKAHQSFPSVINTTYMTGMPYPVFYGYLLFPALAVLSTKFDGGLAVRLASMAIYAIQFLLFYQLVKKESDNRFLSYTVASIVCWSVYPMTNLYNRGAIPEFVGTSLLFCAVALMIFAMRAATLRGCFVASNLAFLAWTFAAGAHPITALYGFIALAAVFLAAAFIIGKQIDYKRLLLCSLVPAVLSFTCLFPWAYATTKCRPTISCTFTNTLYFPTTLDSLYWRLTPLPIPTRSHLHKLQDARIGVKHIDTPISFPLLILFVALAVSALRSQRKNGRLLSVLALWSVLAVAITWSSVTPNTWDQLGELFRSIQFPYRLVTYINLLLLTGVLFCIIFGDRVTTSLERRKVSSGALLLALLLAGVAVSIKIVHAQVVAVANPRASQRRTIVENAMLTEMPKTFYGYPAYYSIGTYKKITDRDVQEKREIVFAPLFEKQFGEVNLATVQGSPDRSASESGKPIGTSVEAFPWNRVVAAGREAPAPMLYEFINKDDNRIAVSAPPGTALRYEFAPDRIWTAFNCVAIPLSQLWLVVSLAGCIFLRRSFSQAPDRSRSDDDAFTENIEKTDKYDVFQS
ncbi:MAG TPA: hypothetical protein V6C72_07885 [Chroococcales cyanobacterium]